MNEIQTHQVKKGWVTPEVTVHGTVEQITQQQIIKRIGASDGYVFIINGPSVGS